MIIGGDPRGEQRAFFALAFAPRIHLFDRERPKPDRAPCAVKAFYVVIDQRRLRAGLDPPDRCNNQLHSGRHRLRGGVIPVRQPHPFKIIEFADFRPEDMNDDIARINQRPVALICTFEPRDDIALMLQLFDQLIDDRADMTHRASARDDHMIGDSRLTAKIDCDDIKRLIVFERRHSHFKKVVGMLPTRFLVVSPATDCTGIET